MKYFLSIAASDSSGGAGIQQDMRIALYKSYWPLTVLTAITAQDFDNVIDVCKVDDTIFEKQIDTIFNSFPIKTIKIGVVSSKKQAEIINKHLRVFRGFIVYDPVMKSSSGFSFNDDSHEIFNRMIYKLNENLIITPNIPELEVLSSKSVLDEQDLIDAVNIIRNGSDYSLYIKGGHFKKDKIEEFLFYKSFNFKFSFPMIEWRYKHGTGCAFSSLLSINLSENYKLKEINQILEMTHEELIICFNNLNNNRQ